MPCRHRRYSTGWERESRFPHSPRIIPAFAPPSRAPMPTALRVPRSETPLPEVWIRTRLLARRDGAPRLEFLEAAPEGRASGAPILFLHGAFGGAWMWREIFMPYFVRRGRAVAAFSLRAHGGSAGRAERRDTRLSDYLEDVLRAFAEFR